MQKFWHSSEVQDYASARVVRNRIQQYQQALAVRLVTDVEYPKAIIKKSVKRPCEFTVFTLTFVVFLL